MLKRFVAMTFVAASAVAAQAANSRPDGDIIQVFALDQSGKKFAENSTATLAEGQSFYVLVRLVNADSEEGAKSHPWVFRPSFDPSSPDWEKYIISINTPKIGLFVGGKTRMAEYVATPEFTPEKLEGFTDLFFKYTAQPGDLGLPVQLLTSDGRIPGDGSTREFKTEGFNTAKVGDQFWALCAPGVATVTNAQFYLDGAWGDKEIFPQKKWPLNDRTTSADPIGTDWTLVRENARVQTIDFDNTYADPGADVWREVASSETTVGTVVGAAGSTVYLWSGDEDVFTFRGAMVTNEEGRAMKEIVIGASGQATFELEAGTAPVGSWTNIFLSATKATDYSAVGDAKDSAKVWRRIRVKTPPPASIRLTWDMTKKSGEYPESGDAVLTITNLLEEAVFEEGYTFTVELPRGPLTEDFTLNLKVRMLEPNEPPYDWDYAYTNCLVSTIVTDVGGSPTGVLSVPRRDVEIKFKAGQTAKKVWVYPVGSMSKAARGESIKFEVEVDPSAPEEAKALQNEDALALRVRDAKPAVVTPQPADVFAVEEPIPVTVMDSYRDLSAPRTYAVKVTPTASTSRELYSSNSVAFQPGKEEEILLDSETVYTILRKRDEEYQADVTVTVTDSLGQKGSQTFKLTIPAKPEDPVIPTVKAVLYDSTSESSLHDGAVFREGDTPYVRFTLSTKDGPVTYAENLHVKLVPRNAATSNLVIQTSEKVLIAAGESVSKLGGLQLKLLDGCRETDGTDGRLEFDIVVTDDEDRPLPSDSCQSDPGGLTLQVENVKPRTTGLYVNGNPESTPDGERYPVEIASGISQKFVASYAEAYSWPDAKNVDLTNGIVTIWCFTDGSTSSTYKYACSTSTTDMAEMSHEFTYAGGADQKISFIPVDKDMLKTLKSDSTPIKATDLDGLWRSLKNDGCEPYVVTVHVGDAPRVILGQETTVTEENDKTGKVRFMLSEASSGSTFLRVTVTSFDTNPQTRGHVSFKATVFEVKDGDTEPKKSLVYNNGAQFDYDALDGTATSADGMDGFFLEVEAFQDVKCTIPQTKFAKAEGYVYVNNCPPVIAPKEPDVFPTNRSVAVGQAFTIDWNVSDVTNDLAHGLTAKWYIDNVLQDAKTLTVTNGTAWHTTTNVFTSDGMHEVRLEVEDKDGESNNGMAKRRWYYYIAPTKTLELRALGPTGTSKTKYASAIGVGKGRVWADGIRGTAEDFAQAWTYNVTKVEAAIYAFGYASAPAPYRDDGTLDPGKGRDLAIDESGNSFDNEVDKGKCYLVDGIYDNYFYCWATAGKDGKEITCLPPAPTVNPTALTSDTLDLDEYDEKKTSYKKSYAEAVFSREMYESDNLGDINQDGIPDLYVTLYKFGLFDETGALSGDDLRKLDTYNADLDGNDQPMPDFLPYMEVSQYSVLIPELPSTWTEEGVPFDAVTEIRGYHWGLNDATAQKTVDGVNNPAAIRNAQSDRIYEDPDLSPTSTLSKVEWLAYVDAGCPGVDKWSPERPTSPILYDTDGDGFSDGYEYFMWYRAHVGWLEGTNHVYLTGERFDKENPSIGETITSEEIEALFDPLSKYGDTSESLTRDTDNDGLPDILEFLLGTNPVHWDTDGDGLPDGYEVAMNGGTETEGSGSVVGIKSDDETKILFDPCGRHVDADEAMFNGDHDAMACAPVGEDPVPVYGFLQPNGTIEYYWSEGATNVVSTNATPCWAFRQVKGSVTNVFVTLDRPEIHDVNGEWILTKSLTEDKCWRVRNLSTNADETIYIRVSPQYLSRGFRADGDAEESGYYPVSIGGGGVTYRVWKYGPRVYDPGQPYGNWVCGEEIAWRPRGEIVWNSYEMLFNIHTHVYQGVARGDGAKSSWDPSVGWGAGKPYTQLDEFLVCFYHYLDGQPESATTNQYGQVLSERPMDLEVRRNRTWVDIWSDYCTDPSTADTDGDGIPDGWELYTLGGPKAYDEMSGERVRAYGPKDKNAPKNPAGGFASDWHGSACSIFFGPYCKSIIDAYCDPQKAHPFWSNKRQPTDPWTDDTDGDGIPDAAEAGCFAYLAQTPAWKDKVPSYPDAIPAPGAGGGLDPLSWDTDLDGLPDPWERQYGTDTMGHDETFAYVSGEDSTVTSKVSNCWCRENDFGEMVPTVDGTVADAGEDYDHDGLLNWQEYLVSAMRCWRYDDTISSWRNVAFDEEEYMMEQNHDPAFWTRRLLCGGVFHVKDAEGHPVTLCAGIDDFGGYFNDQVDSFIYDGQFEEFNPQVQVSGMYDIGANWFSLCTNSFDAAKGRWYMFYDGVYHDLKTGGDKWTVPGMIPDCCNRFTWRAYSLAARQPIFFFSDAAGEMGYWFGSAGSGDYCVAPHRYPGTDPNDPDTDDDGLDDYWELFHGLNPLLGQSDSYRTAGRPPVDCVYEAYVYLDGGDIDRAPSGAVRQYASAENNYWTWLDLLEPDNRHFAVPQRTRERKGSDPAEAGVLNAYDFGRFPWLNGLAYADPDGDNIRNQQEGIFAQVQANTTYLHTDPSPLWMTDKSDEMSLTYRYYQLPDVAPLTDETWMEQDYFTDLFGFDHPWSEFPGFTWDSKKGLTLPKYKLTEWSVPNPSRAEAGNLATVTVADFGWDFEENEGYDTDHDYLSDFEEQQGRTKNASNPQDTDDPLRRQAMWFSGDRSVLQAPPEVERLAPNDTVPAGNDQPYLYFTVECWAKPEGNVRRPQVLVERSIWTSPSNPADDRLLRKNFQIGINGSDSGALWYVKYDSTGTDDRKPIEIANGPEVTTNAWTHIAATYDGENLKMFVNGICVRTLATRVQPEHGVAAVATDFDGTFRRGSIFYYNRAFTVGASIAHPGMLNIANPNASWFGGYYNQYYQGYIDEVRIWDGARTEAEIMANYKKRFTAADVLANRDQVFSAWSVGSTREQVTTGVLPAELKLCWNFDHIPGATQPNWVEQQPAGFSTPENTVDGKAVWSRPKNWSEPWWAGVKLRSNVYKDPAWVPWIIDMVHHLPNYDQTTLDSFYWSENFVGSTAVSEWAKHYFGEGSDAAARYTKFGFPRTHETPVRWTQVSFTKGPPYTVSDRYRTICQLIADEDPLGEVEMKKYAFTMRHALREGFDLLPLGNAYPKRISAAEGGMWDENGAADAWAQTGSDPTDQGLPTWWTDYYLDNHEDPDDPEWFEKVIRWDTPVTYDGMVMPAWQAYIRDLQKGLLPDGKYYEEFVDTVDLNGNGIPDWWETYWKLQNLDADADPDNDGLSTYSEYLSGDGESIDDESPYGVKHGFPFINPNLTRTFGDGVTDYYLPGPATNIDANGRHIYGGEYLGEIFTDHDFMEDWWERGYPRDYVNPKIYDPWEDADGDGWSNFAECRHSLWSGYVTADLVDHWEDAQNAPATELVRDCPSPAIRLNLSYRGKQEISGKPVILRTSTARETVDATFVVSPDAPKADSARVKHLGGFNSESTLHGFLGEGGVLPGSLALERALTGYERTYKWNWEWYDEHNYAHPDETDGNFATFRKYLIDFPKIEFESSYLTWTPVTLSIEDNGGRSAAFLCIDNQTEIGVIDVITGEYTVDLSKFAATDHVDPKLEKSIFRMKYQTRLGNSYPQSITFADPTTGFVREGANTLEVFVDMDGDGRYTPGEPFATVKNVAVGWHKVNAIDVELTDTSHVLPRFSVTSAVSDREVLTGTTFSGKVGEGEAEGGEAGGVAGLTTTIVIRRKTINGFAKSPYTGDPVPQRNLLTKTLVLADRDYVHEGDVLSTEKLDLDWNWLTADAAKLKLGDVTSVGYDIEQVIPLDGNQTSNAVIHSFVNTFATSRTRPVALNYADDAPLYTAAPTFQFQAGDATMPAYKLQVWSSTNVSEKANLVFDTGFKPLPGASSYRDGAYAYCVTPELYVDCAAGTNGSPVFADCSNYYWRVALGNAKFTTAANGEEGAWSGFNRFQTDVMNTNRYPRISTGYGRVGAAVRYYGLAKTNDLSGKVVVEVFSNGDFTGLPLARKRLLYGSLDEQRERMTNLVDTTTRDVLFAGIAPGNVFVRAYIDSNNNNKWDRWEPWGYAAETGIGKSTIFNPLTAAVDDSSANMNRPPLLTVFMEDTDLNQNEIPDCIESRYQTAEGRGSDDPVSGDTDGDGLSDEQETNEYTTNPAVVDTDDDGMWDGWEVWAGTDPLFADGDECADGDVMAYVQTNAYLVTINKGKDDAKTYLVTDLENKPVNGEKTSDYELHSWFEYGSKTLFGVGGVVTNLPAGTLIDATETVDAVFVHSQVYDKFGFDPNTANPAMTNLVNTKPFTALDKYLLIRYFESLGLCTEKKVNATVHWTENPPLEQTWSLKVGDADCDMDGVPDGWELYVMFGTNEVKSLETRKVSPFSRTDARGADLDGDTLNTLAEFRKGGIPTDPWKPNSMYDYLSANGYLLDGASTFNDSVAKSFGDWAALGEDADLDLIASIDEMRAYYLDPAALADLDYRNAWSDGETPDYFRVLTNAASSVTNYLGELFNGAEFIEPDMRQRLGLDETAYAGTRDVQLSGWSGWSIARNIKYSDVNPADMTEAEKLDLVLKYMAIEHPGRFEGSTLDDVIDFLVKRMDDRGVVYLDNLEKIDDVLAYIGGFEGTKADRVANGLRIVDAKVKEANANGDLPLPDPKVRLTIRYTGHAQPAIVVEAYQVSSAYPEYGEQLTAKWTANTTFEAGIAKPVLTLTEGALKQGPARFVVYIDADGDGKFSAGDTSGSATAEVGYLGCDLTMRLGEANPALPVITLANGGDTNATGSAQLVAIVRTKVNGQYITDAAGNYKPRGVMLRKYWNNLGRDVIYPTDFVTEDFIGLDRYLAKDPVEEKLDPSADALLSVEEVTYEIVRIPAAGVKDPEEDSSRISVSNLNHYTWIQIVQTEDGPSNVLHTVDSSVNEEITFRYSLKRDVPAVVSGTADGSGVSFSVPTDGFANTKFWLEIDGGPAGDDAGYVLDGLAAGRMVLDLDWFAAHDIELSAGAHTIRVALGNDKYTVEPDEDAEWSKEATFSVPESAVRNGSLAVRVEHPTATLGAQVTIAAYEKADLANPVAVTNGCAAGATVELKGLRPGVAYYVAAWWVKDPNDGRASKTVRMPYDTWGYLTVLGASVNGFDAKAVKAELAPSATNVVWLQDTDWNDNGILDREEEIRAVNGIASLADEDYESYYETGDLDCDGISDEEDDEPVFDNGSDVLENDVMAYAQVDSFCVWLGRSDDVNGTNWVQYVITDFAKETTADRLENGKIYIPKGTDATKLVSVATTYRYGKKSSKVYGLGHVVGNPETKLAGLQVMDYEWKSLIYIHHQVYERFGFNPNTANGLIPQEDWVNTKAFTKSDKFFVTNYLAAVGAVTGSAWSEWSLSSKRIDFDFDGIPDGWELYTMFGTNGVQALTKTAKNDVLNAWVAGDRNFDPDGDNLTNLHEYNGGAEPTDPWNAYSMYENLAKKGLLLPGTAKFTDKVAKRFGLTPATVNEDSDIDLISNIQELTAYYRDQAALADLSAVDAWSDGTTPDYFRGCGSKYLGEIFNGAEFIEPDVRKVMGLGTLVRSGTRDYETSGWDAWSTARYSIINAEQTLNVEGVVSDELMLLIRYWNVIRPGEFSGTTVSNAMEFFHTTWEGVIRLIDVNGNVVIEAKKPAEIGGAGTIHDADAAQTTTQVMAFFGGQANMEETIARNKKSITADEIVTPEPVVNLVLKYAGNGSCNLVLEAYQTSSVYPEYGEQLTAQWTQPVKFDSGVAKVNEIKTPALGSLKQGPARFLAYIDKDGDGKFSPGDTFGTADVNVGYLGADVEIRLGEANPALPVLRTGDGSNTTWSTIAIVRSAVNGIPLYNEAQGVNFCTFENNVARKALFPSEYISSEFVGIDTTLATQYAADLDGIESVTYEVLRIPRAALETISVTNLNHYMVITNGADKTVVTNVFDSAVNEEFTVHYSNKRDKADEFTWAGSTADDCSFSFSVPDDGFANTRFWLKVNGTPFGSKKAGLPLTGLAGGRMVLDSKWLVENGVAATLRAGEENSFAVMLGNDKFGYDEKAWQTQVNFFVGVKPAFDGQLLVEVRHPTNAVLNATLTVAAYEKPDLAEPVVTVTGQQLGNVVTLSGLRPGQEYYIAAWYVKNAADGRASAEERMPYDTWGYLTSLGESANGFDAKSVKAVDPANRMVDVPMVTNLVFLQDTDWNDNNVIDREEAIISTRSVITGSVSAGGAFKIIDAKNPDPQGGSQIDNDVMAYAVVTYPCVSVTVGADEYLFAVTDLANELTTNRLTKGIPVGTPVRELRSLKTTYMYDYGKTDAEVIGLGTNVQFAADCDWKVSGFSERELVLVHAQVYDAFGFCPNTSNGSIPSANWVNTKPFTNEDRAYVTNYFANVCGVAEAWKYAIPGSSNDYDSDGIINGWELYVMYGPKGAGRNSMVHNPLNAGDRHFDADGDGLDQLHEYDGGYLPTDPWNADTDGDNVTDYYAWQYHLKSLADAAADWDGDGLSNYAEYLIAEVFKLASSVNPDATHSSDGILDYFRKQGELYLGEIFTDHDHMTDAVEDLFPEMNRYMYDAHLDGDGDGWSNWAELCASIASGFESVTVAETNGDTVVTTISQRPLYAGRPQPKIRLTLNYFGSRLPVGKTTTAVVKVYSDGPEMMRNDAIYVVSNVVYGANRVVLEKPFSGSVREGANWFAAYLMVTDDAESASAGESSESTGAALEQFAYAAGMPFGSVGDVRLGWAEPAVAVTVTDQSAIFDRIDLYAGESSRQFENGEPANDKDISHDRWVVDAPNVDWTRERVRIVPYAVRGTKQDYAQDPALIEDDVDIVTNGLGELRVAADFYIDRNNHSLISEADVIDEVNRKFDLDWDGWTSEYFTSLRMQNAVGDVTLVKYRVILGEGSYLGPLSNLDTSYETQTARVFSFPIERRFEATGRRTKAQVVSPIGGGTVYSARPTFRWRLDEPATVTRGYGCSYTAFRIQILDTTTNKPIYDSELQRTPAKDANGEFAWTAPICVGMVLPNGKVFENGTYGWRVQMYNAKFNASTTAQYVSSTFTMAVGLQQEMNDNGYGSVGVAVKYAGPTDVLASGMVHVEAFDTPDFSGEPLSKTMLPANTASLASLASPTANCSVAGLRMGGTYYFRAYIDTNGNGRRDIWESWGYAKANNTDSVAQSFALAGVTSPVAGIFIEDCDTDQDWLPDAWEMVKNGSLDAQGASVDPEGKIVFRGNTYEGLAGISTGLPGASITVFNNLAVAKAMLGLSGEITLDAIREAVEKKIVKNSVKITALTFDQANGKVILNVDAEVAETVAGALLSKFYTVTSPDTVSVKVKVYKVESLAEAWPADPVVTKDVSFGAGVQEITVLLGEGDFTSGFFKIEVEQ